MGVKCFGPVRVKNPHIDTLFISITNTPKPINIGVVYRPPSGDTTLFLNSYQK